MPGTVTVSWTPSPDEKKDDRLHYMITKRDSVKRTWQTLADRLFNNKYTAINIMPGRQYHFRVYARNDMGLSEPSESPKWEVKVKKGKCKKKEGKLAVLITSLFAYGMYALSKAAHLYATYPTMQNTG